MLYVEVVVLCFPPQVLHSSVVHFCINQSAEESHQRFVVGENREVSVSLDQVS